MILYVNSCIRPDSRTDRLAKALLLSLGEYEEINLKKEALLPLDEETLEKRSALCSARCFEDEIFRFSKQFAKADTVVISAPFWDGSFPSVLKVYLERIFTVGLTFRYSEEGFPVGLCHAKKLYYVTTAGGRYLPDFSYEYVKAMATGMLGIRDTELLYAENLDIVGCDPEKILKDAMKRYGLTETKR